MLTRFTNIPVTEGTGEVELLRDLVFVFMFELGGKGSVAAAAAAAAAAAILKPSHKFYVRKWVYPRISEKSYKDILEFCVKG
jgi:hypothetical protein